MSNTLVQKYYKIEDQISNNWPENKNDNILDSETTTSKISIMAPPGTLVKLTDENGHDKDAIIGLSGIYDFDHKEIRISQLRFPDRINNEPLRAALKNILDQFIKNIQNILDTSIDNQNNIDYNYFCESMRDLILKENYSNDNASEIIPSVYGEDGLTGVLSQYIAAQYDYAQGNADLKNIIVNYIVNGGGS